MADILNLKMEDGFLLDWSEKSPIIINNTAAKGLHHPNSPSFQACFHLFSQAVRKAVFFPLHSYSTYKIATTQLQPSRLLPPSLLTPSLLLLLTLETYQTGVAGDEADGKDDRRNFFGGRNERKYEEEPRRHSFSPI